MFEKVSDLMAAKSMPHAVRCGAAWRGSGASSTIESNELLVIKGVKKRLNTKTLKVFSPSSGKKKELAEQCIGVYDLLSNTVIMCIIMYSLVKTSSVIHNVSFL